MLADDLPHVTSLAIRNSCSRFLEGYIHQSQPVLIPEWVMRPLELCIRAFEVLKRERDVFYQVNYVPGPGRRILKPFDHLKLTGSLKTIIFSSTRIL